MTFTAYDALPFALFAIAVLSGGISYYLYSTIGVSAVSWLFIVVCFVALTALHLEFWYCYVSNRVGWFKPEAGRDPE